MLGAEQIYRTDLSPLEKLYIRIFGMPVNGMRIRARRILPLVTSKYKKIMDAGSGPGTFAFAIAKKLPESMVVGVDIDGTLIANDREVAAKMGLRNIDFKTCDVLDLPESQEFDLVLSVDNLEHILDHASAMKKFYGSLKKGGELILHVPGLYRRWPVFGWKENFYVEGHYRPGYTTEQILELAQSAGFKVKELYYTYGWLETITNNISYWITKAEMENKYLYALVFPFLNVLSYFGQWSRPRRGAGVLAILVK